MRMELTSNIIKNFFTEMNKKYGYNFNLFQFSWMLSISLRRWTRSELIFKEIHTCVWVWDVWMNIFSLEIYNELYGQVRCAYSFRDRESIKTGEI